MSIRSRRIFDNFTGLWRQQMGLRYERLRDALSTKRHFRQLLMLLLEMNSNALGSFLSQWGPSILPLLNHQQDSVALLLAFKHEFAPVKYTLCPALMLSSQLMLQANKLQVIFLTITHLPVGKMHTNTTCALRPIAFEIPKYQSRAPIDGLADNRASP